jgi:hypothetical protein
MMIDPKQVDASEAPGHFENQGPKEQAGNSGVDREEQYQQRKDQAPTGASSARDEWIRKRAYEQWEREGRPEGLAQHHWEQASRAEETSEGSPDGARHPQADRQR